MNKTNITLIALAVSTIFATDANAFGRDKKEQPKQNPAPIIKNEPAAPAASPAAVISQPAAVKPAETQVKPKAEITKPVEVEDPAKLKAAAEAKAKAKAEAAEKAKLANEKKREQKTIAWMTAHPLDHYQCGEKTAWNRISSSGYTAENAPQSVKDLQRKQLDACQADIDRIKAQNAPKAEPEPTVTEKATEAATGAKEQAGAFFQKFKDSVKNGATKSECNQAAQVMGQCH